MIYRPSGRLGHGHIQPNNQRTTHSSGGHAWRQAAAGAGAAAAARGRSARGTAPMGSIGEVHHSGGMQQHEMEHTAGRTLARGAPEQRNAIGGTP